MELLKEIMLELDYELITFEFEKELLFVLEFNDELVMF